MPDQSSVGIHRAVGTFFESDKIDTACQALQSAGFSNEQIATQTQTFDPNPPEKTKAASGAMGAAAAGAVIGGFIGFLMAWFSPSLAGFNVVMMTRDLPAALLAAAIGATVGAIGAGLFGALAGVQVPKADFDRTRLSYKYLIEVEGTESELDQAAQILQQQGAKVER
jgi:hypothetical protein